jgi:DNA polymerase elongation subunit (family B)
MAVRGELKPLVERNARSAARGEAAAFARDAAGGRGGGGGGGRDALRSLVDIREFDVTYYSRVSIDLDIRVGEWYRVTPGRGGVVALSKMDKKEFVVMAEPRVLAWDIETTKAPLKFPDAAVDMIYMISYMLDGQVGCGRAARAGARRLGESAEGSEEPQSASNGSSSASCGHEPRVSPRVLLLTAFNPPTSATSIYSIFHPAAHHLQGFLLINREVVSADVPDFEYTPLPEFRGPFTVRNLPNEEGVLRSFLGHIREAKPNIFVTYNGDFFDWPFLDTRCAAWRAAAAAAAAAPPSTAAAQRCTSTGEAAAAVAEEEGGI